MYVSFLLWSLGNFRQLFKWKKKLLLLIFTQLHYTVIVTVRLYTKLERDRIKLWLSEFNVRKNIWSDSDVIVSLSFDNS